MLICSHAFCFQVIYEKARKNANCPYCFAKNGQVLKIGALKLVHMKFKASTSSGGAASKAKKGRGKFH